MKNQKLKNLISRRVFSSLALSEVTILNSEEIAVAMGGVAELSCPSLQTCGSFGNCDKNCALKVS